MLTSPSHRRTRRLGTLITVVLAAVAMVSACGDAAEPAAPSSVVDALPSATTASSPSSTALSSTALSPELRDRLTAGSTTSIRYSTSDGGDRSQNYGLLHLPRLPGWDSGDVPDGSIPIAVLIHGGGWLETIGASVFEPLARNLVGAGFAVWNIEYRRVGSGGGWPTTFADVGDAVDFVRTLGRAVPQLDPDAVTVVGHSAGGQLAAFTASRAITPPDGPGRRPAVVPTTVIALSGSLDMAQTAKSTGNSVKVLGGLPGQVPTRYAAVNPIQRLNPAVPMILVHARNDKTVHYRVSEEFAQRLRDAGGRVTLLPLTRGGHTGPVSHAYGWPKVRKVIIETVLDGYADAVAQPWTP